VRLHLLPQFLVRRMWGSQVLSQNATLLHCKS
jgi:hypothetical protein